MMNIAQEGSWLAKLWSPVWLQIWNELQHISVAVRQWLTEVLELKLSVRLKLLAFGGKFLACIIFVVLVEVNDHEGDVILALVVVHAFVRDGLRYLLQ